MLPHREFDALEKSLHIEFADKHLLQQVFIHRSALNEHHSIGLENNERLEFLGDAVLELVVTEYLYQHYKNNEGELTNWRSALVRGQHLAERAEELHFGDYLYLSRGEAKSGGKAKQLILANTFEAMIGAIYLDQGYGVAQQFIERYILVHLTQILAEGAHVDPKSRLQELTQDKIGVTPTYQVLSEEGPDHNKTFTVAVYLSENKLALGTGSSKQAGQIKAAENALVELEKHPQKLA